MLMKITKYEHACLVVEEQGKRLVIDPGGFTKSLPSNLDNVVGIVITHVHADHFDQKHIDALMQSSSTANIYCTDEVAKQIKQKNMHVVTGGDSGAAGPFKLQFFGAQHAVIHESWPIAQNIGVLVNNKLYYPGDSFTEPKVAVQVLALPISAPWLKLAESMDFLATVKPKIAFPTHNAILSEIGENMAEQMLSGVAKAASGELKPISPGESLEV